MKTKQIAMVAGISIVLLLASAIFSATGTLITVYNTMVQSKVRAQQALSDLDTAYQRRYALVENLVVMVKETKTFEQYQIEIEREIYPKVAEAKAGATKLTLDVPAEVAQRMGQEERLNNFLIQTLDKLLVMAQHYPTITDPVLKDRPETFQALRGLKDSLVQLEDEVQSHRQSFNAAVSAYNQNIQIFPANLVAASWGFSALTGFEVLTPDARNDVRITF